MFFFASELKNLLSSTNKVSNSITRIKNKKKLKSKTPKK